MPVIMREADIAEVIACFKKHRQRGLAVMAACNRVQADMGVNAATVYTWVRRMRSTSDVATQYLQASSLKLAMRVVRKANVEQAIGILSRPNIGVLDPAGEGGVGGGRQFTIGVAMDSLGSVKVGLQIGPAPASQLEASPELVDSGPENEESVIDYTSDEVEEVEEERAPPRKWLYRDPKKPKIEPVPLPEGESAQGRIGKSLEYRLALAKAERKDKAKAMKKAKNKVNKRAAELAAELKKAREQ